MLPGQIITPGDYLARVWVKVYLFDEYTHGKCAYVEKSRAA